MRKTFGLTGLDCANCAAKMERAIAKIDGVLSASVNFLSQKLSLEADEAQFERVLSEAEACVRKIEPDCQIIKK